MIVSIIAPKLHHNCSAKSMVARIVAIIAVSTEIYIYIYREIINIFYYIICNYRNYSMAARVSDAILLQLYEFM